MTYVVLKARLNSSNQTLNQPNNQPTEDGNNVHIVCSKRWFSYDKTDTNSLLL